MKIGAEVIIQALAHHAGHDFAIDHESPDIDTGALGDKLLHHEAHAFDVKGLHHGLGGLLGFGQHDAVAVSAAGDLDDHRRAADLLEDVIQSAASRAKTVLGMPTPALAISCMLRSLSRERTMAIELVVVGTFCISNWRTIDVPYLVRLEAIRGNNYVDVSHFFTFVTNNRVAALHASRSTWRS